MLSSFLSPASPVNKISLILLIYPLVLSGIRIYFGNGMIGKSAMYARHLALLLLVFISVYDMILDYSLNDSSDCP